MYIPNLFNESNKTEIISFIKKYPFGILLTQGGGLPEVTHIPMLIEETKNGALFVGGHLAKPNEQVKSILAGKFAKAIFHGPNAYVSSSWYGHMNVPTWNYIAIHLSGPVQEIIGREEKMTELNKQLSAHEKDKDHIAVLNDLPSTILNPQLDGIIVFRIKVESIEGNYKLSQNRNDSDFKNIVEKLFLSNKLRYFRNIFYRQIGKTF